MLERLTKQMLNSPIYLTEEDARAFLNNIRIYINETQTQYITLEDYLTYNIADKVITILRGE